MSAKGIRKFADLLFTMQKVRHDLLETGCRPRPRKDNQDIRLGQMIDEMKDSALKEFYEITVGKYEGEPI